MTRFQKAIATAFWTGILLAPGVSQAERRLPIKAVTAFVTDFKTPFEEMIVDIDENNFIETDKLTLAITPSTRILDKKGKPLDRHQIRPGMEIEIAGEKLNDRIEVSSIKLKIDHEKWDAKADGYFEGLEGDKAWIDGRAVKLAPGAVIKGKNEWKNKTYSSFNDLFLGATVKVEGVRRADGAIIATKGEAWPNMFMGEDQKILDLVNNSGTLVAASLDGGRAVVAGREVKFAKDRKLHQYVQTVGTKLVPQYLKDIEAEEKGKIIFRFAVIEDESFNAFALPDGAIFIHTGLLKKLKNEAQLASILGHEIAHVTHEHSRKRIYDNKRILGGLAMILGGAILGGQTGAQLGAIAAQAFSNKYSREAEDQADRTGLFYMTQAGYDPREAPKVWGEISKNTRQGSISNFLYSDHSTARARLKNLNRDIAYSYYHMDFNRAFVREREYLTTVGPPLGLMPAAISNATPPAPKPATASSTLVKRAASKKPIKRPRKRP